MNKKILFRIDRDYQHRMRLGETGNLLQACYFRGIQLGYTPGNIYFEWPLKVAYNSEYRQKKYFKPPKNSILPLKFVERKEVKIEDYDEILDLTQPNVFYEKSPGIYKGEKDKDYTGFLNFLNKYYFDTNERPAFDINKDVMDKPYILFHVRIADWSEYRNPDLRVYKHILNLIKREYGDSYEYWKIGEKSRVLDRLFDKVLPYFGDTPNKFIRVMNNSSLLVCCDSGPDAYGMMLGIPEIHIETNRERGYWCIDCWKSRGNVIGKTAYDNIDTNKMKILDKGVPIDDDDIIKFLDNILEKYDK